MAESIVNVRITGDASGLNAAIGQATGQMSKLGKTVTAMGLMQVGATFSQIGSKVTGATDGMISSFSNLETAWAKVQTMIGASGDAASMFGDEIDRLTKTIPTAGGKVEILSGLYQTLSAGITNSAEATMVLEAGMKLALGGATDTFTAVDALTTIIKSYGMEADQATYISDIMFQTYKGGKITIEELAGGIGNVTAIAAQMNFNFEEVSAAIATLTTGGIASDRAITGLTATMTAFLKPSDAMTQAAQSMGYSSATAMMKTRGFSETLKLLTQYTGGSTEAMAALFPNVRALKDVLPLTGEMAGDFAAKIQDMGNAAGNSEEAFSTMAETTESQMALMQARLTDAEAAFGALLVPTQLWVEEMKVNMLEGLSNVNPELGKLIGGIVVIGGELMNTLGPVMQMIGSLALLSVTTGITRGQMLGLGAATVAVGFAMIAITTENQDLRTAMTLLTGVIVGLIAVKWAMAIADITLLGIATVGIGVAIATAAIVAGLAILYDKQAESTEKAALAQEELNEALGMTPSETQVGAGAGFVSQLRGTGTGGFGAGGFEILRWEMVEPQTGNTATAYTEAEKEAFEAQGYYVTSFVPLQQGGVVTSPTAGLIGEAGPEAIIPLDKMGDMFDNKVIIEKGAIVINSNQNPRAIAEEVMKEIRRRQSRTFKT